MVDVTLPQKFGDVPISREDLVRLGLVLDITTISADEYWYVQDRFDPQMVPAWTFPLSPAFVYHRGNSQVSLLENGVRTSTWLKEATFLITTADGEVVARFIKHQFEGLFLTRFFDWKTGRDRKILEL